MVICPIQAVSIKLYNYLFDVTNSSIFTIHFMIESVYLQKLLINADAVRLLVLSWSVVYDFVRNLLILYYAIVIIFVDGIEKMLQIKKKKYKKN